MKNYLLSAGFFLLSVLATDAGHSKQPATSQSILLSTEVYTSGQQENREGRSYLYYVYIVAFVIALLCLCTTTCCMCKEAYCRGKCKGCPCSRRCSTYRKVSNNCQQQPRKSAQYMELQTV